MGKLPGDYSTEVLVLAGLILAAVIVFAVIRDVRTRGRRRSQLRIVVATISEDVEQSGAGIFCTMMLVVHQLGSLYFFLTANGAIQQAACAMVWTGGNVLWGLGVALGRRRTYTVTRDVPPTEPH